MLANLGQQVKNLLAKRKDARMAAVKEESDEGF